MTKGKKNIAEYGHFKKVTDETVLEKIRNIEGDSFSLSPEAYFEIAQLLNLDITYEELCD